MGAWVMREGAISENVRRAVETVMSAGRVPGIVLAVARGQGAPAYLAIGSDAAGRPIDRESLFPVASITKLATALAVLRLADSGLLALDDLLRDYLPVAAAAQPDVTLRTLLCHTSGAPIELAPGTAPYTEELDWPRLRAACAATALEAP